MKLGPLHKTMMTPIEVYDYVLPTIHAWRQAIHRLADETVAFAADPTDLGIFIVAGELNPEMEKWLEPYKN